MDKRFRCIDRPAYGDKATCMACQYYGPTHGTSKWQNCNGLNIKPTDDIKRAHADMQKHGR